MTNLLDFLKRNFHVLTFVVLQILCMVMISRTMNYPGFALARVTKVLTTPINRMCYGVVRHFNFNKENQYLTQQNLELLNAQEGNFLISSDSVTGVEGNYTDTLGRTKRVRLYEYTSANVIYNTIHKKNNYLMIDKGSEDGIAPDMAVLSAEGVVGVVSEVSKHFATVISLLHPDCQISAKVQPANQLGTISWRYGDPQSVYLEDIPEHLNINEGDSVLTSGYSNIFPSGILIGTVSQKSKNPTASFLTLKVQLATDFNHINTVYVVRNLYREELETLKSNMKEDE